MISVAVTEYDDEGIVEECENGWRRFCIETLVRTHFYVVELCRRHRRQGWGLVPPKNRKEMEVLRRQVAAYRWVMEGTGEDFSFCQTCRDLGLDPGIVRRKLLSQANPREDINLLVGWVVRQKERTNGHDGRRQDPATGRVGTGIVARVRDFQRKDGQRKGRRGAQSHAVCRRKNGHSD